MKVGRNQPCPCGSGRKYKQCCEALDHEVGLLFRVTAADVPGLVGNDLGRGRRPRPLPRGASAALSTRRPTAGRSSKHSCPRLPDSRSRQSTLPTILDQYL